MFTKHRLLLIQTVQTCRNVDVPIYKQTQGGDDLGASPGGAIIGGVIGNPNW